MEIMKKSFKLYGLMIAASIMCFILVMSFKMIGTAFLTRETGYIVFGTLEEGEEPKELYTHYFEDGEDEQKKVYEDKGYTLIERAVRSKISAKNELAWNLLCQLFLILLSGVFVYNELWNLGHKDFNGVRHGVVAEDKLKGLKIGVIATLPSLILLTVITIGRATFAKNVSVALFAFLNPYLYNIILLISGDGMMFSQISALQIFGIFALFVFVPLVASVAYIIGYKDIVFSEKLIYKKK
jgi:hypothetical protein